MKDRAPMVADADIVLAVQPPGSSPIFGMPILNADKAKKVYVVKRGQGFTAMRGPCYCR